MLIGCVAVFPTSYIMVFIETRQIFILPLELFLHKAFAQWIAFVFCGLVH